MTVDLVLTTTTMAVMMAILSGQSGWLDDYRWVKVGNYTALTHCILNTLHWAAVPLHLEAF